MATVQTPLKLKFTVRTVRTYCEGVVTYTSASVWLGGEMYAHKNFVGSVLAEDAKKDFLEYDWALRPGSAYTQASLRRMV